MALLEINLKKPALIEERNHPSTGRRTTGTGTRTRTSSSGSAGRGGSSGRSRTKSALGFLLLIVVTAVAAKAIRSRRDSSPSYEDEDEATPIIGAEEAGNGDSSGWKRAVGGLLGAVAVLALVARTVRGRSSN